MNPEVNFEGVEANYINPDRLERTIRLVPSTSGNAASYGELLNMLCGAGVDPEEISGIYKVSAFDRDYSILLKYRDAVDRLISLGKLTQGNYTYDVMKMTEQVVTLRIHWLPLFFDNLILKEIFNQYGEILDITMSKTSHEKLVAFNGTREVRMKVDEFQRQQIPHVVHFNSGQAILVTMAGRPPYCLKCKHVGHVRQRCPLNERSYAATVSNLPTNKESPSADPAPIRAQAASVAPSAEVAVLANAGDGAVAPSGTTEASGGSVTGQEQQGEDMEMDPEKGMKRGRETQESSGSWISPNRTAKSRSRSQVALPLSNAYSPIMEVTDILNSDDS